MSRVRDGLGVAGLMLLFVVLFTIIWGSMFLIRQHGISSCRERGGQPVVRSLINESMWDVSCIEKP